MEFKIKASIVIICVLFLSIVTVIALSGNLNSYPETELSYSIGGCEDRVEVRSVPQTFGEVEVTVQDDRVLINQNLSYVCCAVMTLDWTKQGNLITVTEINEGDICRCICQYNIDATIGPLTPGKYTIRIYGVKYQDIEPDLMAQKEIVITE